MTKNNKEKTHFKKKNLLWLLLLLLLLIIIGLGIFFWLTRQEPNDSPFSAFGKGIRRIFGGYKDKRSTKFENDSLQNAFNKDSSSIVNNLNSLLDTTLTDSLSDSTLVDSLNDSTKAVFNNGLNNKEKNKNKNSKRYKTKRKNSDNGSTSTNQDSVSQKSDSNSTDTNVVVTLSPCQNDTIPPWVYPSPSGGLHYGAISVKLLATESSIIQWKFKGEPTWKNYERPITISKNSTLEYFGIDDCNNVMKKNGEKYEISFQKPTKECPKDMSLIEIGKTKFCIDKYEWPNKKGLRPYSFVSIYQAIDSCFTKDKRLCTSEEWSLACSGAYGWNYNYGDKYEPRACNSTDTAIIKSGSKPECRGYFEVYDMSGNLAEWTNTRSKRNKKFYNVMGGFWESGSETKCFSTRYSYFPQNRHNPVGFRCCKDAQ